MTRFSSMQRFACLLTGAVLASVVSLPPAAAYDDEERVAELEATTARKGNRRVIVEFGSGVQYIDLPDMNWTYLTNLNGEIDKKQKNGEINDYGGAASGTAYIPLGYETSLVISGFYSQAENSKRKNCESTDDLNCTVQNIETIPDQVNSWTLPGFTTRANRDVEYWGASSEVTFGTDRRLKPRRDGGFLFDYYHWGAGFNVRGLDQDNRIKLHYDVPENSIRLDETIDTTYYGGYLSVTGEFNILGYFGIGSNWNIRSFATFRGGVYGTDTDYHGRFLMEDLLNLQETRLRLSDDEVAFIGSASFETRVPICRRTSLSLLTDYEYFSYVPQVRYAAGQDVTRLGDDDMLAVRTQIRFNIGFGPDGLYEQDSLK